MLETRNAKSNQTLSKSEFNSIVINCMELSTSVLIIIDIKSQIKLATQFQALHQHSHSNQNHYQMLTKKITYCSI